MVKRDRKQSSIYHYTDDICAYKESTNISTFQQIKFQK